MLEQLTRHFGEPVMPVSRYCQKLQAWARCIDERASRLEKELLPNLHDWDGSKRTEQAEAQRAEYDRVKARAALRDLVPTIFSMVSKEAAQEIFKLVAVVTDTPRQSQLDDLLTFENAAFQVDRTFLSIGKSNLLARILYSGEKVRTKMCPEHKGKWSGIEWGDNACPHKCQLTGWIQEEDDQGKPLPGVQGVRLVPSGDAGEVTMIRDVDGEVLGKAVVERPLQCREIWDEHSECVCVLGAGHPLPHKDDHGNTWPKIQ